MSSAVLTNWVSKEYLPNAMLRIACIIPTYNGKTELSRLLASLKRQTASFVTFVVDSSSTDGTQALAIEYGLQPYVITSAEFNHGGTRQLIVDRNPGFDVYVFLTQDAELVDPDAIALIISSFNDPQVGAVCGRQLPHLDATSLAQHARSFNYPEEVLIKTMRNVPELGIKAAFMSNSFAAYRAQALQAVGGFPNHVIFAEDMFVAARMLMAGLKVVYAGNAVCRHSHNYTLPEEFRRYFDMGVLHAREPWIREHFGGAGGEGLRYVLSELKFLGLRRLHSWPGSLLRNAGKLLGYKLGQYEALIPISMKRKLSMHKRYWDSTCAG